MKENKNKDFDANWLRSYEGFESMSDEELENLIHCFKLVCDWVYEISTDKTIKKNSYEDSS